MNKRHYEHTLPNIRGSLSNTYGTSEKTFFALKILLGWDWQEQIESLETREISPAIMNAKDIETGVKYYFVVGNHDIPENVLDISD